MRVSPPLGGDHQWAQFDNGRIEYQRRSPPPEFVEELKRRRRRERWSAFLTPLITLASLVVSIGFLMFIIRTCDQRVPHNPLFQQRGTRPPPDLTPTRPQP